jgi:hypothetical protein
MPEDMAVLIAQAVEKAVQPLRDEIASLKEKTAALKPLRPHSRTISSSSSS